MAAARLPGGRRQVGPFPETPHPRRQRHEPEKSLLYTIVAEHLETFLAEAAERHERGLPRYVEREFRAFLDCGILTRGFAVAKCSRCGRSLLVAFSCKKRGPTCSSCGARRMYAAAAQIVDRVIPDVHVRQFVLSVPFELRLLLAARADAFGAMTRLFVEQVFRWQRDRARELGLRQHVESGAVVAQHRAGSSINLNPHLHAVLPDGVFSVSDPLRRALFHRLPAPSSLDLIDIAQNIHQRFVAWLGRKGLLLREDGDQLSDDAERGQVSGSGAMLAAAMVARGRGAGHPPCRPVPATCATFRPARAAPPPAARLAGGLMWPTRLAYGLHSHAAGSCGTSPGVEGWLPWLGSDPCRVRWRSL